MDREAMMHWHLTGNHFPPHPESMVPVALAAVDAVEAGNLDEIIELPEGVQYQREPTALNLLETFHIDVFRCDWCDNVTVTNPCDCYAADGE